MVAIVYPNRIHFGVCVRNLNIGVGMMLRYFRMAIWVVCLVPNLVLAAKIFPLSVPQPDPVNELWRWQVFSERDGLASVRIDDIAQARGLVWFATDQGVSCYDGMQWKTYTDQDGLPSNEIQAVLPVADGVVWVGTDNGVARLSSLDAPNGSVGELTDRARWQVFTEDDGLPGIVVEDLLEDQDGRVWAATDNGAAFFDGQAWQSFTTADGLAHDQVNDMALGSDGSIWFATEKGASQYDGVTWHSFRLLHL